MIWNLNKIQQPIYNLGPGKRYGIWVQGCSIRCNACINKSTWPAEGGKPISLLWVFNHILETASSYNGVTITGGEPFDQYPQLMAFSTLLKRKTNLNVLCYSGYYLEELEGKYPDKAFYSCIDYLIDGRYIAKGTSKSSLIGSSNQSVYSFANGEAQKTMLESPCKKWSLNSSEDTIYMAGIPANGELEAIIEDFKSENINTEIV